MLQIIEDATLLDKKLLELWTLFKTIKEFPFVEQPEIKDKNLDPLVNGKRWKATFFI